MRCKNHDYIYYDESWRDETTGILYQKGYYDEDGNFYDGNSIAFKKPDGSYEAHYKCDFCDTELETNWKEGFYPTCKNCGAEMNKTPVYIDDIVDVSMAPSTGKTLGSFGKVILICIAISFIMPMFSSIMMFMQMSKIIGDDNSWDDVEDESYEYVEEEEQETNLEIYGTDIYLDEISHNIYRICSEQDEYEKHITWDYGAESYYDYDSDCYLWYNTDVSPNLWQYWYESVAGSNYYGWMECEGDKWYIEVSDTEWEEYNGDTSQLWHIENPFD